MLSATISPLVPSDKKSKLYCALSRSVSLVKAGFSDQEDAGYKRGVLRICDLGGRLYM